ncbi:MAG: organic solvent tolerance ABC transporter substrate-binding protein [Candidatus Rokuibacteriota bacterium]|nr:MAG: organic solvent tolerance ABC transporter substrate-binding protein [Candidatus Rokubacteria bacterium]
MKHGEEESAMRGQIFGATRGLRRATTVASLLVLCAAPAWAGAPTDQLKQYTNEVLKILDDPKLRGEGQALQRRAAVRKVALDVFDVGETAKRALGRHWGARTPEERREFTDLFADLLERTYLSRIDQYGGEKVQYVSEAIDGDNAIVRAKVITRKGAEVPVESRLLRHGDRWLMYDVLLENISLVGNYRAQFDQIIRQSSYDELAKRLRDKRSDPSRP